MQDGHRRARLWSPRPLITLVVCIFAITSCSFGDDSSSAPETNITTAGPGVSVDGSSVPGTEDSVDPRSWFDVLGEQAQTTFPAGKYVSPSGNNSNGGTSPNDAWKTVAFGLSRVGAGETLFLMGGTYNESLSTSASGRADAWIRVTAYPGEKPVITQYNASGIQFEGGAQYIEISGVEFAGNPDPNFSQGSWPGAGIVIFTGAHHIRIYNNNIHSYGAGGVVGFKSSHIDVRNNVVWETSYLENNQHSGISFFELANVGGGDDSNGYSNYVIGNLVYRNENKNRSPSGDITDGNCVIIDRFKISGYNGRTLIADNICIDNGGRALNVFKSSKVDVFNNTAYHNLRTPDIARDGGEMFAYESSDVHFANNLIFARPGVRPIYTAGSSNVNFTNNMFVGDQNPGQGSSDLYFPAGTSVVKEASTSAVASNFDLVAGSPAINAGAPGIPAPVKTDYIGRARVLGGAPDIGAYEFRSAGSDPAPPPTTAAPTTEAPNSAPPTTSASTSPPSTRAPSTGSPSTSESAAPAAPPQSAPSGSPQTEPSSTSPESSNEPEVAAPAPTETIQPQAAPSSNTPSRAAKGGPAPAAAPTSPTTAPAVLAPVNGLAPTTTGPPPQAPALDDSPVVSSDSEIDSAAPDLPFVEASKSNGSGLWIALSLVFLASGIGAMQMSSNASRRRN